MVVLDIQECDTEITVDGITTIHITTTVLTVTGDGVFTEIHGETHIGITDTTTGIDPMYIWVIHLDLAGTEGITPAGMEVGRAFHLKVMAMEIRITTGTQVVGDTLRMDTEVVDTVDLEMVDLEMVVMEDMDIIIRITITIPGTMAEIGGIEIDGTGRIQEEDILVEAILLAVQW